MTATADPTGPDPTTGAGPVAPVGYHVVRRPVPGSVVADQPGERAGFWRRTGAWVVDVVVVNVALAPTPALSEELTAVLGVCLTTAYFVVLHGLWGRTLGKAAFSIRVRAVEADRPIGLWRATLRFWAAAVSAAVLLLGHLWMLWDPARQTWHDKYADSLVVRSS